MVMVPWYRLVGHCLGLTQAPDRGVGRWDVVVRGRQSSPSHDVSVVIHGEQARLVKTVKVQEMGSRTHPGSDRRFPHPVMGARRMRAWDPLKE